VAIVLGLGSISLASFAAAQGVKAYREWKASQPEPPPIEESAQHEEEEQEPQTSSEKEEEEGPRENIFKKWFDAGVGAKYYEGGFEETMTRREAALILGVRESSTAKRIKEAHRKLLILNHPDTGGSTYMSGKINEAKELLLKGRKQ
jgi:squalene cyclase